MSASWFWPDWRATDPDDPPEYDPDDAEAQWYAETPPTPTPSTTASKPGDG